CLARSGGEKSIEYLVRRTALKMMCCEIGAMKVRLSYHADQSFHEGTSRSSRATSPPPRYPCRRSAGRQYRGWEYCIDAAQETGSSSKTCDGPGYRTTGSERGPKRADVKQQGS